MLFAQVNHHFDYRLDGHSRKYMQHCISNKTHSEVYLVREFDGYKIPYQSLYCEYARLPGYCRVRLFVLYSRVFNRVASHGTSSRNQRIVLRHVHSSASVRRHGPVEHRHALVLSSRDELSPYFALGSFSRGKARLYRLRYKRSYV